MICCCYKKKIDKQNFKMCEVIKHFHRIVHLDLKGAPLKIPYLEKVLLMAKSWGATGCLLEWEDTFPYSGDISMLGSEENSGGDGMYSMQEVQHIFQFARDNGLLAIQLVQTIGHLEFVLKHPAFADLREIPSSPAVLCPTKERSRKLIRLMIDQALDAQPDAKYFHIGADEVWHKIQCFDCQKMSFTKQFEGDGVFLEYIQNLVSYIHQKRPHLTVLMWDDMLRPIPEDALRAYKLSNIQPVYWNYNTMENFRTDFVLWQKYTNVFPKMWAGSAFKGANGSCQILSSVSRYVSNHDAWIREIRFNKDRIEIVGIILTGWSRYDHYATLCELMPVMLPTLASCLRLIINSDFVARECPSHNDPESVLERHLNLYGRTTKPTDGQTYYINGEMLDLLVKELLPSNEWPGEDLARRLHAFVMLRDRCMALLQGDEVATWLNPWQIERKYTVCIHVQSIAYNARVLFDELKAIQRDITPDLHAITGKRSVDEWVGTNITPLIAKVSQIYEAADKAMARDGGVRA